MREATIHIPDEALESLGIGTFVSTIREYGLQSVSELECDRPGCLLVVRTEDRIPPATLAGLSDLVWWERLTGRETSTYLCKVAVPALEDDLEPSSETGVTEPEITSTETGIDVRVVGTQEALSDRVTEYDDVATVALRSLGAYEGPEEPLDAVTARQREVLETARDLGYFEVPRAVTTEAVAADLDLSPATVREHLQRAQHNVMLAVLGSRDATRE